MIMARKVFIFPLGINNKVQTGMYWVERNCLQFVLCSKLFSVAIGWMLDRNPMHPI